MRSTTWSRLSATCDTRVVDVGSGSIAISSTEAEAVWDLAATGITSGSTDLAGSTSCSFIPLASCAETAGDKRKRNSNTIKYFIVLTIIYFCV